MHRGWVWFVTLLLLGSAGYMVASRLAFAAPTPPAGSDAESNDCGFTPGDFTASGDLRFPPGQAWWVSFLRQQEYFSALSIGFVTAFLGFAIRKIRQIGAGATSGALAGGSLLAVLALCLGCLAPALSAIGLGLLANLSLLQTLPKWLMTLNTILLTITGMVFLQRRARACPLQPRQAEAQAMPSPLDTVKVGQ